MTRNDTLNGVVQSVLPKYRNESEGQRIDQTAVYRKESDDKPKNNLKRQHSQSLCLTAPVISEKIY